FLDELPETHVEVMEARGGFGGMGYGNAGASRFDAMTHFGSSYSTPGWQRAQRNKDARKARRFGDPDDDDGSDSGAGFGEDAQRDYEADAADTARPAAKAGATGSPPPFREGGAGRG